MITQIFSSDINQNATRFVTEEIESSGTSPRNINITYNPIGFSNMLSHAFIDAANAGMEPATIVVDSNFNIFFTDGARIRKITPSGVIQTIIGQNNGGYSGDGGPAISGTLNAPQGMDIDSLGNLYIADSQNNRIRKINTSGIVTTVAGNGNTSSTGDGGLAISGSMFTPIDVAVGPSGIFYVCDLNGEKIRKIDQNGIIHTVAGDGLFGPGTYTGDGTPASGMSLQNPIGVTVGPSGDFYFSNTFSHIIIHVGSNGLMTKVAGIDMTSGYNGENIPASGAQLYYPSKIQLDVSGSLYVTEGLNGVNTRIRKIHNGIINTYAGNGDGSGGAAILEGVAASGTSIVQQNLPGGFYIDSTFNMYIAAFSSGRIRKVNPSGIINTIAGYGNTSFTEGAYLFDSMYVPFNYINSVLTNPPDSVRYCNTSGTNVFINLDNLQGFNANSIDKFIISYTTNE